MHCLVILMFQFCCFSDVKLQLLQKDHCESLKAVTHFRSSRYNITLPEQ